MLQEKCKIHLFVFFSLDNKQILIFLPHKTDQAYSKVNTGSNSWSSTAWTWMEVVWSLIQSFWMRGISCEQRNKQTKKVVQNCRFSRIPEMIYFRAGFRMANRCKGFFWLLFSELAVPLPTRGLGSRCFLTLSPFLWTSRIHFQSMVCLKRFVWLGESMPREWGDISLYYSFY